MTSRTQVELQPIQLTNELGSILFTHDGKRSSTGWADGKIKLTDMDSQTSRNVIWTQNCPFFPGFMPDGSTLASGSSDETIQFWELPSGTPSRSSSDAAWRCLVSAFSHDGNMVAAGSRNTSETIMTLEVHVPDRIHDLDPKEWGNFTHSRLTQA